MLFPPSFANKLRMSTISTLQHILAVTATAIREGKEVKDFQIRKEDTKLWLFGDHMNVYIENPKDYSNKAPRNNK